MTGKQNQLTRFIQKKRELEFFKSGFLGAFSLVINLTEKKNVLKPSMKANEERSLKLMVFLLLNKPDVAEGQL